MSATKMTSKSIFVSVAAGSVALALGGCESDGIPNEPPPEERLGVSTAALTPAAFPSRVRVMSKWLVDSNDYPLTLKGFNVHVATAPGDETFVWSQSDYTAMATRGAKLVRHIVHWDTFEKTAGTMDATALASLDTAIARAKTAGMYTLLELHLNSNRVPAWATGASEWDKYIAHGQYITQQLATRYKDEVAVIGFNPNEPTTTNLATLMSGNATMVGWWQSIVPEWPVWVAMGAYGGGTPSPTSGTQASTASYKALDRGRGVILEVHDYLNLAGALPIYQANGSVYPIQQGGTGQYHGWGGSYTYPNTAQSRTDSASFLAPQVAFRDTGGGTFALAMGEFGIDNAGGEGAFGTDKAKAYRQAGAIVELWWNYDLAPIASSGFSARPGGSWRPAVTNWITNATAVNLPSAYTVIVGNTTVGASGGASGPYIPYTQGVVHAHRFTANASKTIYQLGLYVDGWTWSSAQVAIGLYSASGSNPGSLIGSCSLASFVPGRIDGWAYCNLPSGVSVTNGATYFGALFTKSGDLSYRVTTPSGATGQAFKSAPGKTALPASFGAATGLTTAGLAFKALGR